MDESLQLQPSAKLPNDAAASYLGKSGSWLNKMRAAGKGPRYMKIGGRVLYRVADLDAYVDSCSRETDDTRRAA